MKTLYQFVKDERDEAGQGMMSEIISPCIVQVGELKKTSVQSTILHKFMVMTSLFQIPENKTSQHKQLPVNEC